MKSFPSIILTLLVAVLPIQFVLSQVAEQSKSGEILVSNFYSSLNNYAKLKTENERRISKIRIKEQFLSTSAILHNDLSTSGSSIYEPDIYIDNIKIFYPYEDNPLQYEVTILGSSPLLNIESSSRKYYYVLYNLTLKGKQNNKKLIDKKLALKAQLFINFDEEPKIGNVSVLSENEKVDLLRKKEVIAEKQEDIPKKTEIPSNTTNNKSVRIFDKFDYIGQLSEGLQAVAKNCKWGYIDEKGIEIIPLKYDHADKFSEGKAAVKLEGQYGFINKNDETVIDFKYTYAKPFQEGSAIVGIYGQGDFLINTAGQVISPTEIPQANIDEFYDGLARIWFNLSSIKKGYIDRRGKIAIKREYNFVTDFNNGSAFVTQNGKVFIINVKGKIIKKVENLLLDEARSYLFLNKNKDVLNFTKDKMDGYIDKSGNIHMYPKHNYDLLWRFQNGYAKVKKNNKFGFINESFVETIPVIYDDVQSFSEGLAAVKKNGLWGFIDSIGNIVINFKFKEVRDFSENKCCVGLQDKTYGFIDKKGNLLFKFDDWPRGDSEYKDGTVDLLNGLVLNENGRCIENCHMDACPQRIINENENKKDRPENALLNFFSLINNLIDSDVDVQDKEIFKSELLEVYLDKGNSLLNSISSDKATIFLNGTQFLSSVLQQSDVVKYSVNNLKIAGPFDINYEVKNKLDLYAISFVLEINKKNNLKEFKNMYAHIVKRSFGSDYIKLLTIADFPNDQKIKETELQSANKSKIFQKRNELEKKLGASYVEFIFNDLYSFNINSKIGLVNSNGKILITPQYDMVTKLSNDLIALRENKKYGIFTKALKQLTPIIYDEIGSANNQYIVVGKKSTNRKWGEDYGMIDIKGQEILPLKYYGLKPFEDGLAVFKDMNKSSFHAYYGYINLEGNTIIESKFSDAYSFNKGYAAVESGGGSFINGKWGFIDKKGTVVVDFKYDVIYAISDGYYLAKLDGKYGYLDYKGDVVLPFIYTQAFPFENGYACVRLENDDWVGIINKKGATVLPFAFRKTITGVSTWRDNVLNELQSFKFEDLNPKNIR